DGSEGPEAAEARKLAALLSRELGVPAVLADERFTSTAANRAMAAADVDSRRRRPLVDKVAAALMLQGWLDAAGRDEGVPGTGPPRREDGPVGGGG
ncbi:MAG: Holliday junction resolvase RuvX, partial [Actinomycetota bacterium]